MPPRPVVSVEPAKAEERELLVRLVQLYLHDLSAVEAWDVDESGSFGEDDLDGCWTDPLRHPFVIRADDRVAGFAIVDEGSDVTDDRTVFDMAESFILRRWRRQGVGLEAVRQLLAWSPGRWEVRPFPGHQPGDQFWRRACADLTSGEITSGSYDRAGNTFPMYSFCTP